MPRFIVQHEKHLCMWKEPLMLADGSLSFHGMKFLESMWREKESNKENPFLHLLNGAFKINDKITDVDEKGAFQDYLDNIKHVLSSEKPTFFLFAEANLHWIPLLAYRENGKIHLFIFDPAPLNTFNWEVDSEAFDPESERDEIIYYRNEALFKGDKEVSHLSTDSGCGVFAFKWAHKLFFYKDLDLEAFKSALSIKEASAYEKERGIVFSFQLPKSLAYLSHLRETYAFAQAQKRRMLPTAPYNTTLEYFVEKAHTKLKDLIHRNERVLEILNQYIGENLEAITHAQEELVAYLKKEYQENPAVFNETILPLAWKDFNELSLSEEERELALSEYYKNPYHSALRYLLRDKVWETREVFDDLSPWYSDAHPDLYGVIIPTKDLLPLIALMYLIADKKVEVIKGHQVTLSKQKLLNSLALFAREQNRDTAYFTFPQAIDDLLQDSPAMFFEAQEVLLHLVEGISFKPLQEQIQVNLNEFIYHHIKSHINFAPVFKEILDSQLMPEKLSQFNVSAEKIEELVVSLKRKYKGDFAFDSEFLIRKQLELGSCESHFSKFYNPVFESRYLEELKQKIQSNFSETNLNKAHELFNQYLSLPVCLQGLVKEKLKVISGIEGALALLLIAHLENNPDSKSSFYEKINTTYETQELGLFECSDAEIAAAILKVNPETLWQENRNVKGFIREHAGLLREALTSMDAAVEIIIDSETPRQRAGFFPSPSAKRRRVNDNLIAGASSLSI